MVSNIKVNGWDQIGMAMEFNIGLMELNITDVGKKIKLVEKESLSMLMEIFMRVSGKMIRLLALESTYIQSHRLNMKDTGKMIQCTVQESKSTQTVINMKECLNKVNDVGKEHTTFQMAKFTKVNGTTEKLKALEYVNGLMEKLMKVIGLIIRKMEWVFSNGLMGVNIVDTIEMIKNMVKVHMFGQMVENISVNGKMINVMEKVNMSLVKNKVKKASGKKMYE